VTRKVLFFPLILMGLISPPLFPSSSAGGPIFPEQALQEQALQEPRREKKIIPIFVKNPGKKMNQVFTLDLHDGLNADEAGMLAAITNPRAMKTREEKGLKIPQLMESGVLAPVVLKKAGKEKDGEGPEPWLPAKRLKALEEVADKATASASPQEIEVESAWLEWQAFEAARLYLYRRMNSRRIINVLRQIKKTYKDIYKTSSRDEYRKMYGEKRAISRTGFKKMERSIKREKKALSAARVGLDHALDLPTYLELPLQNDMRFNLPRRRPTAAELINGLPNHRIDFMALQRGIMDKDPERMGYIFSKFEAISVFMEKQKKAQWLDATRLGVDMDFPFLSGTIDNAPLEASDGKVLFTEYNKRLKNAKMDIARLVQGMGFLEDELAKVDLILPSLSAAAKKAARGKDAVLALEKKKTLLAVRLLHLRLMRKLMDTTMALEITSGQKIAEDTPSAR